MDSQSFNITRDIATPYRQSQSILPLRNSSPNELHVAAALGLSSFVKTIVDRNPKLALNFDEHGLTPCHLAVANGHISVVKELLDSKVGVDICCLRDKGGFLPIHIAVMKGRVNVLKVVSDTCHMWMFRELTWQGDNILHLALKFDSLEAFRYLWHFLRGDKKLLNTSDAEGNTLLHLAVAKRQQEVVKILVGKLDLNAININGSTALDIFFDMIHKHGDMTLEEMIRNASWTRAPRHEASQPSFTRQPHQLHLGESRTEPSLLEAGIDILFHLQEKLFDFRRALSRRVPSGKDREISNTLMIVATLIATITFQSALNPPGGFIQDGEDIGMAVMESYLSPYLLFDMMAFISSLSVILLTIYAVPKWKDLIKLAMFITWISVFFTFLSFQYAIAIIFGHAIRDPLILVVLCIGDGVVLVFAFVMFVYTWYLLHKSMSAFLHARSREETICRSKIIAISCLAFLGAAIVWLPIVVLDISRFYM